VENELNALLGELHTRNAVGYHLGDVMENLLEFHSPFEKKDDLLKRKLAESLIKKGKPRLHAAMDHLDRYAMVIGNLEMLYQQILDHPEWDLESRVSLENSAREHVINLKRLHGKQKEALTAITQAFLAISKDHVRKLKTSR
jgi:hypothetical protein